MAKAKKPKAKAPVPRTEAWRMPAELPEHVIVDGDEAADATLRAYRTGAAYAVQPEIVAIVDAPSDARSAHAAAMLRDGALDLGVLAYDHAYADGLTPRERRPYDNYSGDIFAAQQARMTWQRVYCQIAAGRERGEPRLLELALDPTAAPPVRASAAQAILGWRMSRSEQRPIPTAAPERVRALVPLLDEPGIEAVALRVAGVHALALAGTADELPAAFARALDDDDGDRVGAFVVAFAQTALPVPASLGPGLARALYRPEAAPFVLKLLRRLPPAPAIDAVIAYARSSAADCVTRPLAAQLLIDIGGAGSAPALVALLDVEATSAIADAVADRLGELDDPKVADALEQFVIAFRARWGKNGKLFAERATRVIEALRRPR